MATNTTALDALSLRVGELESAGLVTTQVTGDDDVHTVGTLDISGAEQTTVTFADTFNNGISHAVDSSIFNVMAAGDYSINVCLRVTAGTVTHRGLYWAILRRYTQRTTTEVTGTAYRDYQLGSSYYRTNIVVLGGNLRVQFESPLEQFEIIVQRAYQLNVDTGANEIDNAVSYINIEKHGSVAIEGEDADEDDGEYTDTIEITTANDTLAFRHIYDPYTVTSASTAYSITLDAGSYYIDQMVAALNASIVEQGAAANGITTSMAISDGRFVIQCNTDYPVFRIEIIQTYNQIQPLPSHNLAIRSDSRMIRPLWVMVAA